MTEYQSRHVMHEGQKRLFFCEAKLNVHLGFEWKGGIRSGKYILFDVWNKWEEPVRFGPFPSNWRLTKKDRDFIEKELEKEE